MFYPADPRRLRQEIEACFKHELGPGKLPGKPERPRSITAIVCPHAGYMYSGPVAAHGYLSLSEEEKADTFIVIGPNHTGYGTPVSMMGQGSWETPLGKVDVDSELAQLIFKASDVIDLDETAHIREHSVEVQLPFLQYLYGSDLKIIPICMGFQDLETSREVGRVLATFVTERRHNCLHRPQPPGAPGVYEQERRARARSDKGNGRGGTPGRRTQAQDKHVWIRPRLGGHSRLEAPRGGQSGSIITPHKWGYYG
jgi:AmmeMemoRadiSam system protein B